MNWYPEVVESANAKSQMALYPTPGLALFANVDGPIRGEFTVADPITGAPGFFAVGGEILWELDKNGNFVDGGNKGNVGNDFQPVTICTNGSAGNQLAICSAGKVYIFYLAQSGNNLVNTLVQAAGILGFANQIVFCDGYGVVPLKNTNKFQVSGLEDMSSWNALSVQQVSVFSENIGAVLQVFRQLWFFGVNGHSQVYYNSGASAFTPFDVIQGAYMEEGINAPLSAFLRLITPILCCGGEK